MRLARHNAHLSTSTILAALSLLMLALVLPGSARANPGDLDTTFGSVGWVTTNISPDPSYPIDFAFSVGIQSNGKIILAGYAQRGGALNHRQIALVRYDVNGSLDGSFGSGGKVVTPIGSLDNAAQAMTIQADDKILVAGFAELSYFGYDFSLARYTPDGSLDASFGSGGVVNTVFTPHTFPVSSHAWAVEVQPDGKIVAAGNANYGANPTLAVARYNSDGSLDTTFDGDGKVTTDCGVFSNTVEALQAIAFQPDGKILAAGYCPDGPGSYDFALVRYNADGSLDATFGPGGLVVTEPGVSISQASDVALQTVGSTTRILVAGYSNSGSYNDITLLGYRMDGSLDSGFGTGGILTTDLGMASSATALQLLGNGGIVLAGGSGADFVLTAYGPHGTLDAGFGTGGIVTTDFGLAQADGARSIALQPDGKVVAAGYSARGSGGTDYDFAAARYEGPTETPALPGSSLWGTTALFVILLGALWFGIRRRRSTTIRA